MATDSLLSLARIDTDRLAQLWERVAALPAKLRVGEAELAETPDELVATLAPMLGQPAWLIAALLEAVLAERGSFAANKVEYKIERHYGDTSPELVWSGHAGSNTARMTRWVIDDLFRSASHNVLIAGYSFDGAKDLFVPLFERADKLVAQGLAPPKVKVILDCSRVKVEWGDVDETRIAKEAGDKFKDTCWMNATLPAEFYYYAPSTVRKKSFTPGSFAFAPNSMHAKCIAVDRTCALVGSANFSSRARDNHANVEVGALIRDHHFVESLLAAWDALAPELVRLPDSKVS